MSGSDYRRNYSEYLDKIGWDPSSGIDGFRVAPPPDDSTYTVPPDDLDDLPEITICAVCGVRLNRFTGPDGILAYVHSRPWNRYDHDPIAKHVPRPPMHEQDIVCDFCGLGGDVIWRYTGDRIQQINGNLGNDFGHMFAGCRDCEPFVDAVDVEGLIDRLERVSSLMKDEHDLYVRNGIRRRLMDLHSRYLPSIHLKEYIGRPVKPAQLNPRLMPKIRDGLLRFWSHPDLYDRLIKPGHGVSVPGVHVGWDRPTGLTDFMASFYGPDLIPREVFARHTEHLSMGIETAQLFYISSNFTTLAAQAGLELSDVSVTREELPSASGIIVYEDPIGEIARPYGMAGIRALSWTVVPEGVWINAYIQGEDGNPVVTDIAEMRAQYGYLMCPNIGAGIPFLGLGGVDDNFRRDGNFLLTLLATWFLMAQPGVATETTAPHDKKLIRSAKRAGKRLPDVRIIDLRRHSRPRPEADTDTDRRKVSVRFMVRGHWKRQAYGPKRGLRKTIYVAPFLKGPDNAPLKTDVPTVRVLR